MAHLSTGWRIWRINTYRDGQRLVDARLVATLLLSSVNNFFLETPSIYFGEHPMGLYLRGGLSFTFAVQLLPYSIFEITGFDSSMGALMNPSFFLIIQQLNSSSNGNTFSKISDQ